MSDHETSDQELSLSEPASSSTHARRARALSRPGPKKSRPHCRRWAVTLNPKGGRLAEGHEGPRMDAPQPPEFDRFSLHYAVWVKHNAAELHWHAYLHFKEPRYMSQVKSYLGCPWAHCEPIKDHRAYEDYLRDGHTLEEGPLEFGREVAQGHRTDWERVQGMATFGFGLKEVMEVMPGKGREINAVRQVIALFAPPPPVRRDVRVHILWGPTGTGKTHRVRMTYPRAYIIQGKYHEGRSFDQYQENLELILDEWRSFEWPLSVMLGLLDVWVVPLVCRYQNRYGLWDKVFITTNEEPEDWYRNDHTGRAAFLRRVTDIHRVEDRDFVIEL